ncbi:putative 26S proteasome non-ATPase regulatory subunit 14 like protein [Blattamonas nauphoetae]|uniref:26S proteasome non-ATPase regulatory subunit 14 like protein n=1 Tax=Blattamonas nauphoetae TaxID=2049346 RepID=A0ABQ9YFF3_9EUKA|nr:putative 26S proteasome non-ATPase regulatory subunit 14 like protein [Blattamonas nauphoetae]
MMIDPSNMAMGGMGMGMDRDPKTGVPDRGETIQISSLALLKMLKHGRAGVPLEVMGLMLGSFVDDYVIKVDDVFAMPQSGTGVSVEAVDPVFQAEMLEMLKKTGRSENVVGWYHSHPGFGPWLSNVDVQTQISFERLHPRCVAVVVDPVQSVRGKVVIDAFRSIPQMSLITGQEPRQTTSNLGHLMRPSYVSLVHGCGTTYYNMPIDYRKNTLEEQMLINLKQKEWVEGLLMKGFDTLTEENNTQLKEMKTMTDLLNERITDETAALQSENPHKEILVPVGKVDPKKRLQGCIQTSIETNLNQILGVMLSTAAF